MGRKQHGATIQEGTAATENGTGQTEVLGSIVEVVNGKPKKSKRERFLSLVEKRMTTALRRLKMCARLGNKGQYEYNDAEARKIVDDLSTAVVEVQIAFSDKQKRAQGWTL